MRAVGIVLAFVCIGEFFYIFLIRKQLAEWLVFLKNLHKEPERKFFVKGNDILADINFELNNILGENRRQFVQLRRAETANRQLLTDLSHDVKTPLASLLGYLEALDSHSAKEQEEYIRIAYRKALDLQELIDMLFQWFPLASGEQGYRMEVYDLNELTREIITEHIPVLEKKKILLLADIPDDEWVVKVDRVAYARILNNLFSNAVKHGKCSRIEVVTEKSGNRVLVSVSNNGTVIPGEELPFIFGRLYQCSSACSGNGNGFGNGNGSGNGIGLAIVRELTTAMSGGVTVQSVQGGKTTFRVALPLWNG